jgi:gliding motility-associated-like protein
MNEMIQEVSEPNPLEMQTSVEHILCPEGTGAIDLTITGGVPGYNVVWNDTLFSEDASGLEAGSYSGVLTDDNGCQDSVLVEINETLSSEPAYIENASGSAELNCLVTEIEVNAQGGSAFNWSGGTSPNTSWNIFNTPGNYIVDYLDSNGCALQMNILISENINPPLLDIDNITNSTNELNCNEPEIILFGSGADSYIWNDTIQNISTTISSPGEYSVIGIGNNGCIDSTTIIITANFELPNLILQNISGSDTLDCNNTSIDIVASGASNYEWSNGIGTQSTITINEGGTYYITALGDNGCSVQDSIEIIEISFPVLSVNSETICAGNMIELVAEASIPGGTYTWSNNLGSNSSVFVEPISNAVFTVDYILNGCESNTATSIISVLPTPVVSISGVNSICSSQSVSLTGEPSLPGGSFEWFPNGEIEPTITTFPQSSTTYGLSYTLNGCPSDTVEAFVEVIPTPVVTLEDVSICDGESGTLIAQPSITGGTFNWTSSGQNTQSITENPDTTTSYSVIYALNGCLSQLTTASIIVNPIPDLFVADIGICAGQTGVLNAQGSPNGGSFQWTGYIEDESVLEVNPLVTSNYTVTYTLNNCSSSIESAEVTVTEQPVLSTENQGICEGESVVLTAIPSVLGGQYLWLPNNETSETITVSPNTTTTYEVMYTINGCQTDLEPIIVSVDAMPITTFDVNVTSGCAPLNVVFTNTTSNTSGCTWSINDGSTFSGCENMSYTFLNEGCYDVTLVTETPNGCPGIMNMENLICVFPSPNIDFSASTNQISYGSSEVIFSNNSSGAESYFWDFGDGSSDTLYNPNLVEYEVNDETFFTVSLFGISELGCTDSLQLDINVNQDAIIFAPNSFTPDGDGLNDSWYPTISTGIDEDFFSVQIYNRWGELIFEATDFISSWDGTYQGMQSPIGTYTFRIEYKEKQSEKRKIILGHINLIR